MKTFFGAHRICIALLCALGAGVASATQLLPWGSEVPSGMSFYVPTDADINLCVKGTATCGPVKRLAAGTAPVTNCGLMFVAPAAPAGSVLVCREAIAVVAPPAPPAPPQPFTACYPQLDFSLTWNGWVSANYKYADVPASVGSPEPYIGWFKDTCENKFTAQYFSKSDIGNLADAAAKQLLGNSGAINAWVAAQPITALTASQEVYRTQMLATLNATPVVVFTMKVAPIAAGTRPFYDLKSDGTRGTTKRGDVAVNTDCDQNVRVGATSFYKIPSLGMFVASCVAK